MPRLCKHDGCGRQPVFNVEGETRGLYCATHQLPGMVNVVSKRCVHDGCQTRPSYNVEGETRGLYCATHRLVGMVDVVSKRCVHDGCQTLPSYNVEGETRGLYCATHQLPGMVNVVSKRCVHDGCQTLPTYNVEGETRGLYCATHRLVGMVDVEHRRCVHDGCGRNPSYNVDGETRGLYCATHQLPGMVDVVSKRCQHDGCDCRPTYNVEGETRGLYCATHRLVGMVDVVNKRCQHDGCTKLTPSYNVDGQTRGLYCATHQLPGMVNVVSKRCQHDGCPTHPSYGFPGYSKTYCVTHRPSGTIRDPRRKCQGTDGDECKEVATYGPSSSDPIHCEQHSVPDDQCLIERSCVTCHRVDILNAVGQCINFCSMEEQDRQFKKRIKVKEETIGRLLVDQIGTPFFSTDTVIDSSCTRRRPDFVYHFGTHILIIEVDEHQHKGYHCTAYGDDKAGRLKGEQIRMYQIGQCFDGLPVLFLRYNPDTYKVNGGSSKDRVAMADRHATLVRWVRHLQVVATWMVGFHVKYLFYDHHDPSDVQWTPVTEQCVS